jgi:hypothetical protein
MKVDISVPKVVSIFEEPQAHLEKFIEMISVDIRQSVWGYLYELKEMERTRFFGRGHYKRVEGKSDHPNGTSTRYGMK